MDVVRNAIARQRLSWLFEGQVAVDSRMMTIRSARMSREDVILERITVCDKICRRGTKHCEDAEKIGGR